MIRIITLIITICGVGLCSLKPAQASFRHFTYTYESLVVPKGEIEIEPWTTFRLGRKDFFFKLDQRLEMEFGVSQNLQMSWYLNWNGKTETISPGTRASEFEFKGVSNEWKYKLSDPVADAFGSALYFEWSSGPKESEIEGKAIFDKRLGNFLLALNLAVEGEWEYETTDTESNLQVEVNAGATYSPTPKLSFGLELLQANGFPSANRWDFATVSVGPVINYIQDGWWFTFTVLPQIANLKPRPGDGILDLQANERLQARILFGFDL